MVTWPYLAVHTPVLDQTCPQLGWNKPLDWWTKLPAVAFKVVSYNTAMALCVDGAWQMALELFECGAIFHGADQIGYSTAIKACEAGNLWQGLRPDDAVG